MPIYTLFVTGIDGHQHAPVAEFPDDEIARRDARERLTHEHRSVALARGAGAVLEFMGVWARDEQGRVGWTADD